MSDKIFCKCGCGEELEKLDSRGRVREYIHGHHWRGKERPDKARPESVVSRTGRWRAREIFTPNEKPCELLHIGGCSNRIEAHHVDQNPMNNQDGNVMILCTAHHRLVEKGHIDLANPIMPPFIISSGKRRYPWLINRTWSVNEQV